jgi:hypothetical protein
MQGLPLYLRALGQAFAPGMHSGHGLPSVCGLDYGADDRQIFLTPDGMGHLGKADRGFTVAWLQLARLDAAHCSGSKH